MQADALDLLGDTVTYGLALPSLAPPCASAPAACSGRRPVADDLGAGLDAITCTLILGLPRAEIMGVIGILALAANLASVLILIRYKDGDANIRSVWLCSRNDAIGNVIVMIGGSAPCGCTREGLAGPDRRRHHGVPVPDLGGADPPAGLGDTLAREQGSRSAGKVERRRASAWPSPFDTRTSPRPTPCCPPNSRILHDE